MPPLKEFIDALWAYSEHSAGRVLDVFNTIAPPMDNYSQLNEADLDARLYQTWGSLPQHTQVRIQRGEVDIVPFKNRFNKNITFIGPHALLKFCSQPINGKLRADNMRAIYDLLYKNIGRVVPYVGNSLSTLIPRDLYFIETVYALSKRQHSPYLDYTLLAWRCIRLFWLTKPLYAPLVTAMFDTVGLLTTVAAADYSGDVERRHLWFLFFGTVGNLVVNDFPHDEFFYTGLDRGAPLDRLSYSDIQYGVGVGARVLISVTLKSTVEARNLFLTLFLRNHGKMDDVAGYFERSAQFATLRSGEAGAVPYKSIGYAFCVALATMHFNLQTAVQEQLNTSDLVVNWFVEFGNRHPLLHRVVRSVCLHYLRGNSERMNAFARSIPALSVEDQAAKRIRTQQRFRAMSSVLAQIDEWRSSK